MRKISYYALFLACFIFFKPLQCFAENSSFIELNTAAQADSFPKYYQDPKTGKMQGLAIEIMQAIEKQNSRIKFTGYNRPMPWKRLQDYLQKGKLDIFFGITKSAYRERIYQFILTPLYPVNHVVAVRTDDDISVTNYDDIAKLGEQGIILTIAGSAIINYLASQNGKLIIDSSGLTISDTLERLVRKRGRFIYYHDLGLYGDIKRYNHQTRVKILPTSFRQYNHYAAFAPNTPKEVVLEVSQSLDSLQKTGQLQAIYKKYLTF